MAMLDPLFMDIDEVYSGDEFGLPYRDLIGEGVVDLAGGDFEVTAGSGNSVDVAAGAAWVEGDTNTARQPTYRCINDATINLGISPDPSNPRKVLILIQVTDEAFDGTGRDVEMVALHGTPAASPADPTLPDSAYKVATLTVPAAAADSSAYTITDDRGAASIGGGNLELLSGAGDAAVAVRVKLASDTAALTASTFNTVSWGAEDFDHGAAAFHDTGTNPSRITVPSGLGGKYLIMARVRSVAAYAANTAQMKLLLNGTTQIDVDQLEAGSGNAKMALECQTIYALAAGDYVEVQVNPGTQTPTLEADDCHFELVRLGS